MWRLRPSVLCGALWAGVAYLHIRSGLARRGVKAQVLPTFGLPQSAGVGVSAVLRRLRPSCLEKALIVQRWEAGQGLYRSVVVGVPESGFAHGTAHAWIAGTAGGEGYVPIHTFPPPGEPSLIEE